jgi:hypothetical protein
MNKKYVVDLTEVERKRLRKLISTGSAPARMLNRARILLKADVGEHVAEEALIDKEIAEMLDTSTTTVQRERERFCRQGLERSLPDKDLRAFSGRASRSPSDRPGLF